MPDERQFLFVCGCARSGTTALALLLNHHPDICIGLERFSKLSLGRKLSKELFEPKRFADIRPEDCGYPTFDERSRSVDLPDRITTAHVVGDKQPRFFAVYDHLQAVFPQATHIYIARNIFDVAASYKRRLLDQQDPAWNRDVSRAISEWNESIAKTLTFRRQAAVLIVEYEKLFGTGEGIDQLAAFIGVDPAPFRAAIPEFLLRSKLLARKRAASPVLTFEERLQIAVRADREGHQQLVGHSARHDGPSLSDSASAGRRGSNSEIAARRMAPPEEDTP